MQDFKDTPLLRKEGGLKKDWIGSVATLMAVEV